MSYTFSIKCDETVYRILQLVLSLLSERVSFFNHIMHVMIFELIWGLVVTSENQQITNLAIRDLVVPVMLIISKIEWAKGKKRKEKKKKTVLLQDFTET